MVTNRWIHGGRGGSGEYSYNEKHIVEATPTMLCCSLSHLSTDYILTVNTTNIKPLNINPLEY